ncbi:hypothetical protein V6N13_015165 [Hibiscus sabdariffa]
MELSSVNHFDKQSLIHDESLDFIFTKSFQSAPEFIDDSLKVGGIITVQQLGEGCFLQAMDSGIANLSIADGKEEALEITAELEEAVVDAVEVTWAKCGWVSCCRSMCG